MLCLAVAAIGLVAGTPALADGVIVGAFCVEGVKRTPLPSSQTDIADGVWTAQRYSYDAPASGASTGSIVVFNKAVQPNNSVPPTCANARIAAQAQGAHVVLEGRLEALSMRVDKLTVGSINSYVISPQQFVVTIRKVASGFSRIGGGTMDLAGSKAWIENPEQLNISGGGMTGRLRIESWDRTLKDAVFQTSAGETVKQTLRAEGPQNTVLDLDTATGEARLYRGDLIAKAVTLPKLRLEGEMAAFDGSVLKVGLVRLRARDGATDVSWDDVKGRASQGLVGQVPFSATFGASVLGWRTASAMAQVDTAVIKVGALAFQDLDLAADGVRLSLSGGELVTGKASGKFARLGRSAVKGGVTFTSPNTPALAYILPAGAINTARIDVDGPPAALLVRGAFDTTRMELGGLGIRAPVALTFERQPGQSEVRIPIAVHVGPVGGSVEVRDSQPKAVLQAELSKLDFNGTLVLDVANVKASRIEALADALRLEMKASVSIEPFVAGVKPNLAQLGVAAVNPTAIVVRDGASTGAIDISTPTLVIANPVVQMGAGGSAAVVKASLTAEASSTFRYDLARSSLQLVEGSFKLADVTIASDDPTFEADLGGAVIERASFKLRALAIQATKEDMRATVSGADLAFGGSRIRSKGGKGMTYSGAIAAPLTIGEIRGAAVFTEKKLGLTELAIRNFGVAVDNAKIDLQGGMRLKDAKFSLNAEEIRQVSNQKEGVEPRDGVYLTNLRLRAAGTLQMGGDVHLIVAPRISALDITVNGHTESLNGGGSAALEGFAGRFDTDLDTAFECENGQTLKVPVRAHAAVGPSTMEVTAKNGKFVSKANLNGMVIDVLSQAAKQCKSKDLNYHVDAVWASMTGWCPTWRNPGRTCTWKTIVVPEINIGYYIKLNILALHAGVGMTNPKLLIDGGGVGLCNVGRVQLVTPVIIASYAPQLKDNGIVAQAVNIVVEGVALSTETTLATGILNGVAGAVSLPILNDAGSVFCFSNGKYPEITVDFPHVTVSP